MLGGVVSADSEQCQRMSQKSGGYIPIQIALDFKLNFDIIAIKEKFKKISVTYQKNYGPTQSKSS